VDAPANAGGRPSRAQPTPIPASKRQQGRSDESADGELSRPLGGERGGLLSHEQNLVRTALDAGSAVVIALNKSDLMTRQDASDALRGLQQQLERMEDGAGIAVTVSLVPLSMHALQRGWADTAPSHIAESSSASFVQAVSALNGKGVNDMLEAVAETFERYSKRIASRELHEWLQVRGVLFVCPLCAFVASMFLGV
jgi:hypothetical protein